MTKEQFRRWRCEELSITQDRMAHLLGYSKRTIQDWEAGINQVPKPVDVLKKYVEQNRQLIDENRQLEKQIQQLRGQ